jgi:hypothetical protein
MRLCKKVKYEVLKIQIGCQTEDKLKLEYKLGA